MLKFTTPTGSIEATAADEQRVRGMSDAALCRELNTATKPDLFVIAVLKERTNIHFVQGFGWQSVQ